MRLATDRIARQRSAPDPRPLVVTGRRGNIERLTAVDAAAAALGLRLGLALAEARARYPDLAVVAEDAADDRRLLDGIADWCQRYTPLLAVDPPDDVLRQLARALGTEREPLTPLLPVAAYVAEQSFSEPIAREEDVLHVIARLAARLEPVLERRGKGARCIELALFRTDGAVRRIVVATSRSVRDPSDVRALYVERLASLADALDPGFGFDLARLSVLAAEPCPPEQIGLGERVDDADLDRLIDRLSARLGARRVMRLLANDSHIPEVAAASVPAQAG